jgi:hypothetical protein
MTRGKFTPYRPGADEVLPYAVQVPEDVFDLLAQDRMLDAFELLAQQWRRLVLTERVQHDTISELAARALRLEHELRKIRKGGGDGVR